MADRPTKAQIELPEGYAPMINRLRAQLETARKALEEIREVGKDYPGEFGYVVEVADAALIDIGKGQKGGK